MELGQSQELPLIHKYVLTAVLFFCSLSYGMTTYILGPALNEFRSRLDTDLEHLGYVLGSIGLMYTIGAVVNGVLYNFINRQLMLAGLMATMGVVILWAPHTTHLWQLFTVAIVAGFASGGYDTAGIVWMIELWKSQSATYLLSSQFLFSVGTFVSPLMSKPFLSTNVTHVYNCSDNWSTTIEPVTDSFEPTTTTENSACIEGNKTYIVIERIASKIEIPFSIVSGFLFISSLLLIVTHFIHRYEVPRPTKEPEDETTKVSEWSFPRGINLALFLLGIMMIGPYVGMEICNFQLISSYSLHSYIHLDDQDAALTQSILAGSFMVARGLSIVFTRFLKPSTIMPIFYVLIFGANIFVVTCAMNELSRTNFYLSQAALGAGFSVVLTSTYSYLEESLVITDLLGGLFVCSGGTTIAIFCIICGAFVENVPLIIYYFNFGATIIISISFAVFVSLKRWHYYRQASLTTNRCDNN